MVYAQHWGMRVFTFLKGDLKGQDALGNCYYQERFWFSTPRRSPRRWVIYRDILEGSAVPAEWFGWLRHEFDTPLDLKSKKFWQKSHEPNKTGTDQAYCPPGHRADDSLSSKVASQAYEPWQPL